MGRNQVGHEREVGAGSQPKALAASPAARITQQFRELRNLTYELECDGVLLVLRIFFPLENVGDDDWRVEARACARNETSLASANAKTRAGAFDLIAGQWRYTAAASALGIDWAAVARAMKAVRAI